MVLTAGNSVDCLVLSDQIGFFITFNNMDVVQEIIMFCFGTHHHGAEAENHLEVERQRSVCGQNVRAIFPS